MDELDRFWTKHFNRPTAKIERHLIASFYKILGFDDPMFPVLMMQVCILYETLGSVEKAVLLHGPALEDRMVNLRGEIDGLSDDLSKMIENLSALKTISSRLLDVQQRLVAHRDLELRLSVTRVVRMWKRSAALITTYAGLVIRSWAFSRR